MFTPENCWLGDKSSLWGFGPIFRGYVSCREGSIPNTAYSYPFLNCACVDFSNCVRINVMSGMILKRILVNIIRARWQIGKLLLSNLFVPCQIWIPWHISKSNLFHVKIYVFHVNHNFYQILKTNMKFPVQHGMYPSLVAMLASSREGNRYDILYIWPLNIVILRWYIMKPSRSWIFEEK